MIKDNKDKQDLDYYYEVLEELHRLCRQTLNRYKEFESISFRCNDIINIALYNTMLYIDHYKNELENEINRKNQENR